MLAAFELGHLVYSGGVPDAHGNASETWTEAEPVWAYSIAPYAPPSEPVNGRDEWISKVNVLFPVGTQIGYRDRLIIQGDEFEVIGGLRDWTLGPYGYGPGVEILAQRVEG